MIRYYGVFILFCVCNLHAQNYFNITNSQNPRLSANTGVVELKNDTLFVAGLTSTLLDPTFSQRVVYLVSGTTGDTIKSINIRDTSYYSNTATNDLFLIGKSIYLLTYLQKTDSSTMTITKLSKTGQIIWDKMFPFTFLYQTFRSITALNDNSLLLCGEKETSFGNLDMRLL